MTKTSADPMPWVHQGYRSANEWEPTNPHGDRTHGLWRPRPEFDAVEATTLWKCPECGDVMPAGYGEEDHFNCNRPSDYPENIGDTCCGNCPGASCYVDQVTGA